MDSASFPVIFFDGGLEVDIGDILVHPSLQFNVFISFISQKIGVSPHQISTSLVRRNTATTSPEIRRKLPIDESSNFASIAKQRDCYILAILKRSRRTRWRRRGERGKAPVAVKAEMIVPEKTILKRFSDIDVAGAVGLRSWSYERQLQELQMEMERYLMLTEMACAPLAAAVPADGFPVASSELVAMGSSSSEMITAAAAESAVCEECVAAEGGRSDEFHCCVYDAVTVGFRSTVGPIRRPSH